MTKSELVARLAARHSQLAAGDSDEVVHSLLAALTRALVAGQRVEVRGFGSFALTQRAPRLGRNPKTGEPVHVPGKRVAHFKPGKELREQVDGGGKASKLFDERAQR